MERLKYWLKVNAGFSFVCALIMICFNSSLQVIFGFQQPLVFLILAMHLILFAMMVYWTSVNENPPPFLVSLIIWLDSAWVLGSLVLIILQPFDLTGLGYVIIGSVAVIVGFFGLQQSRLKRGV